MDRDVPAVPIPLSLRALADIVVPTDDFPGGWNGGVGQMLEREWDRDLAWAQNMLLKLGARAEELSPGTAEFVELPSNEQELIVAQLSEDEETVEAFATLIRICREGYYGGNDRTPPAGWGMLSYTPWPFAESPTIVPGEPEESPHIRNRYDAIIVGSGPGGSATAWSLANAGLTVLVVERSMPLTDRELRGDHIRGKRLALYRPTAGPGRGNPRVVQEADGTYWVADGDASGEAFGLNAMVVGGGSRLWQGMSWRFLPADFEMASRYGVPDGSSLTDWPITYQDLAPFYDLAESELGVSGEVGPLTGRLQHPGYPMPPMPTDPTRDLLVNAASRKGWSAGAVPIAINSVPRSGRAACVRCNQCLGHTCPIGAKNGAQNTFLPRAIATGLCDFSTGGQAVRIVQRDGVAEGIEIVWRANGTRRIIESDIVIVSAGAVETPRLILASGLGNDIVGKNLQGHIISSSVGFSPIPIPTFSGPGQSVGTLDFAHAGGAPFGGGALFDLPSPYPLQLAQWADAFSVLPYGSAHKEWVRRALGSILGVMAMGQEVPTAAARVELDPDVVDSAGMPVARLVKAEHAETDRVRKFLDVKCGEWLEVAGCDSIVDLMAPSVGNERNRRSPGSEHSAGTVRMGDDPDLSAAGRDGLVHGSRNVYVSDGSLLPTNGSVNPTLTMLANALRVAEGIPR